MRSFIEVLLRVAVPLEPPWTRPAPGEACPKVLVPALGPRRSAPASAGVLAWDDADRRRTTGGPRHVRPARGGDRHRRAAGRGGPRLRRPYSGRRAAAGHRVR